MPKGVHTGKLPIPSQRLNSLGNSPYIFIQPILENWFSGIIFGKSSTQKLVLQGPLACP